MFYVQRVKKKSEIERLFALRYQVYCQEKMFLDPKDYPDGLEHDEYGASAIHLDAYAPGDQLIGSLRLVRLTSMHFPIFEHYEVRNLPKDAKSLECIELSRPMISKRKRAAVRSPEMRAAPNVEGARQEFANFGVSNLLMELLRVMFVHAKQRGMKYILAAMEPSLIRLLQQYHFNFYPIGPLADYYGQVLPCIASFDEIEKHVAEKKYRVLSPVCQVHDRSDHQLNGRNYVASG
jgi:N-acyl amino acid synthase of PEP-CTERM/exosortase system